MAEFKVPVVNDVDQDTYEIPGLSELGPKESITVPKVGPPGPDDTYLLAGDVRIAGDLTVDGAQLTFVPDGDPGVPGALYWDDVEGALKVSGK